MNQPKPAATARTAFRAFGPAGLAVLAVLLIAACGSSGGTSADGAPGGASGTAGAGNGGASAGTGGDNHAAAGGPALGGAGGSSAGTGGHSEAGSGGQSSAGAGGQAANPACVKPSGTDITTHSYTLSGSGGCFFSATYQEPSITITDEATFQQTFHCQAGVSSGIDFTMYRLEVAIFSSAAPVPQTWAVETGDAIHIGFTPVPSCGGAAPPPQSALILLPASPKPVVLDLCTSGCNFGSGGFPA